MVGPVSCVVLHSTESDPGSCQAVADYLVHMGYESHEVYDPSCDELIQLLPMSEPGKALVNLPGGVETNNRGGVYQIEIVGRAVDVPNYDDNWYENLRNRLETVCGFTGTPYVFPLPFQPYPQSYGNNLVRMTFDEWLVFEGVCGHQHIPENEHGDPGALDVERLILYPTAKEIAEAIMDELVPSHDYDSGGDSQITVRQWMSYMLANANLARLHDAGVAPK